MKLHQPTRVKTRKSTNTHNKSRKPVKRTKRHTQHKSTRNLHITPFSSTTTSSNLPTSSIPNIPKTTLHTTQIRHKWSAAEEPFLSRAKRFIVDTFKLRPPPPSINVEEFALVSKMFHAIIDVRSEEQRREGKIPKSIHVPLDTMTDEQRVNLTVQFNELTVLCYDQDGSSVELATSFLRDCGAEAWSLEGGADSFKEFVQQTRDGTYVRRVTLEEAKQHVHQQSRAGIKLPRSYDTNRTMETFVDDEELDKGSSATVTINKQQRDV